MRFTVRLVLLLFVFFLSTPTIVSVIKKSCDTSYFYSMSEEELTHKDVKAELHYQYPCEFVSAAGYTSGPVVSRPAAKHDPVSSRIFIPPPERV